MIVDAHAHLLPGRLAAAIRTFFERHITTEFAYPLDPRATLDQLHSQGITTIWNLPYAHRPGMAARLNTDTAAITAELTHHPVQVITGCTVHPGDPHPAGDLNRAVAEHGARVCKLHCSVGGFTVDDPRLRPVFDEASELGVPVVVHVGRGVTGHTSADELTALETVLARHPETTIVIAHFAHQAEAEAGRLLERHPNLYADLTPVVAAPIALSAETARRFGDRLLFGTDAPNACIAAPSLLARLRALALSDEAFHAITAENATRLVV